MQYFGFDRPSFGLRTFGFGSAPVTDAEILAVFSGGKQGVWYDQSDLSTLFQDAAGTVPVTANGDPVGLMLDKSGNGNHATQTVSASRPTYKTNGILHRISFDGVDDSFENIGTFSLKEQTFAIAYDQKPKNQILMSAVGSLGYYRYFSGQTNGVDTGSGALLKSLHVDSVAIDIPASSTALNTAVSGKHIQYWVTDSTARYLSTWALGGYKGLPIFGDMYGLVFVNTDTITTGQRLQLERYLAVKAGITL